MRVLRVWEVNGRVWVIEFPDEQAARRAREEYAWRAEFEGTEEADAWAENIVARHDGRLL